MPDRLASLQLTPEAIAVLKDGGITNLEGLAEANVTDLQNRFVAAAQIGRYPEKFPSLVKIAAWVEQARNLVRQQPDGGPSTDLDNIPTAIVKPAEKKAYRGSGVKGNAPLVELRNDRHRRVKRDPEATVSAATGERVILTPRGEEVAPHVATELNPDKSRTLHHRRAAPSLQTSPASPTTPAEHVAAVEPQPEAVAPVVEQRPQPGFKTFDDYKEGRVSVKPLDRHSLRLGEDVSRSTGTEQESFEEEIAYKKRMPIWRVRGVKHPDGLKVYIGSVITVIAVLLTITTVVIGAIFPFYNLEEYRIEFAILFGITLLFGFFYIVTAIGTRCRVCSCHLFYSRRCLKNKKAHRILGGFPMVAQAIHIIFWRWFRCMYCGTAVRLTEESANHDYD